MAFRPSFSRIIVPAAKQSRFHWNYSRIKACCGRENQFSCYPLYLAALKSQQVTIDEGKSNKLREK